MQKGRKEGAALLQTSVQTTQAVEQNRKSAVNFLVNLKPLGCILIRVDSHVPDQVGQPAAPTGGHI